MQTSTPPDPTSADGAADDESRRGGALHVVATPIGNLGDLSPRAADVLRRADLVLAEDTRRTGKLLAHVRSLSPSGAQDERAPMLSLHEHNEDDRVEAVVERLRNGDLVALVSDAGMPGVSDPGHRLVRACVERGVEVVVVPGPSAVLAALVGSGLATDRFTFEGFLPRKGRARRERLQELSAEPRTIVVFASPHRVGQDLADLADALGAERPAAVARELTKLHEEFLRGSLADLAAVAHDGLRGEIVLVVEGAPRGDVVETSAEDLAGEVQALVRTGQRSKDAIAQVALSRSVPKKVVYQAFLDFGATGSSSTTT